MTFISIIVLSIAVALVALNQMRLYRELQLVRQELTWVAEQLLPGYVSGWALVQGGDNT